MLNEGFRTPDGRVVYSVRYTLQPRRRPDTIQLIVPLDASGNARHGRTRAAQWGKRLVDVWPGELIRFDHRKFLVTAVEAYRWSKDGVCFGRT